MNANLIIPMIVLSAAAAGNEKALEILEAMEKAAKNAHTANGALNKLAGSTMTVSVKSKDTDEVLNRTKSVSLVRVWEGRLNKAIARFDELVKYANQVIEAPVKTAAPAAAGSLMDMFTAQFGTAA